MAAKHKYSDKKSNKVQLTKTELEETLKTREYRLTEGRRDSMFIPKKLVKSEAWLDLKTSAACHVYMFFLAKCKPKQVPERSMSSHKKWIISTNGEIQFTYNEALDEWGIKEGRFKKAIDELIRVGLIDIIRSGHGLHKDITLYAISNRWKKFGTDGFIVKKRQKRKINYSFAKGNKHGKNSGKNKVNMCL